MKNEKLRKIIDSMRKPVTTMVKFAIITLAVISSFYLGRFIENRENRKEETTERSVNFVKRADVNIAIDEGNNLLIIDNRTGDYTVLQDSIGNSIFKLYARNIWAQHSNE